MDAARHADDLGQRESGEHRGPHDGGGEAFLGAHSSPVALEVVGDGADLGSDAALR